MLIRVSLLGWPELTYLKINMGISMRMATLMQLHREETYHVHNSTPDVIIRSESARRTLVSCPGLLVQIGGL